ncbi:hypothetical protein GNI_079650 [Gregarina niphandrodes]|uniref:Uncharacterized protein n=1 Tax=Gregarina niphandrodes TaxID=110365 RepID=A0A023B6I0_GRENI|nr:hypothetical protein GNI_079650 [Gregarina niphandrodes]EZG66549.1 hypothetical protein GNI_079650 [Gregarina niphandrodes]|eukprot:XP_011130619.1 hypothetical protein GNI_079650 [Gregarina niphandrodes]
MKPSKLLTDCDQKQDGQIKDIEGREKETREEVEVLKAKLESLMEHLDGKEDPATDVQGTIDELRESIDKLAKHDQAQQAEIQDVAEREALLQKELEKQVGWLAEYGKNLQEQIDNINRKLVDMVTCMQTTVGTQAEALKAAA